MTSHIPTVHEVPTTLKQRPWLYVRVQWIPEPLTNPPVISATLGRWYLRAGFTGRMNIRPELAWGNPFYVGQDYCVGWMGVYIGAEFAG